MNTLSSAALGTRLRQTGRDFIYLLVSGPIMLAAFVAAITALSVGAGLVVMLVGLPLIVGSLYLARFAATIERRLGPALTGVKAVPATYTGRDRSAHWLRQLTTPLNDPQSWLDIAWVGIGFVFSTFSWSLALTWVAAIAMIVIGPLGFLFPGFNAGGHGLAFLFDASPSPLFVLIIDVALGVVAALTAPSVSRWLAVTQRRLANALVSTRPQLERLHESRSAALRAETDELRRLERDIHDGPQQRLVRLNMDLARAKRQAKLDPAKTEAIIADAMIQTQEALAELRQLSRGIAPPVLADRGLAAALDDLAARSSVPVTVYASVSPQALHIETAAYFVAAEALTNLNKHSGASAADLVVAVQDDLLYLAVSDNGVGGASPAKGHGLAGLAERLKGVDGTLTVTSPVGGPTRIEAVIPCAS